MQDNIWQVESILENTYKITNVLPKGQYGQSYCIDHIQWNMPLRIKKLNNLQDRYSRHALDSWIHASESMFLVNAYVIKDIDSQSCLITEYIEGVSWGTYIQQSILDKERLYIALQLTNALLEIHSKNIVHGNLHPQNILINHNSRLFLNDLTCRYSEDGNIFKKDLQNYAVHLYELFSQKTFTGDFEWTQEAPWNPLVEICFQSQPLHILSDIFEVLQNQYEAYEQRYTKNLWLSATIQVESIHKPAFGNIERKNLKEAEYLWRCASEAYPPSMNAIWNYYLCKLRKGLITPCMFINLLTEQPTDKEKIYCMQAEIALEFGCQVLEVLKNLQEYNALNLARTESLDLEAELLYRVRKYEEAKEKWLAIFDLDNLSSKECYKLTISCYACGDKQGAREFCDKGLQLHPHSNLLQLVDAILTMDKNEDEEIVSEKFQILETKYGSVYWIMMHVAEYYATLGTEESQEQAQEIYQELLKINPLSQRALKWYSACEGNQLKYNIGQMQLEEWSQIQTLQKHENIITALAMTPDGKIAVSGDCEGRIHCWNIENSSYWMELVGHTKHITSLAISTDAKIVASGSWDQEVKIWDMETGKEIRNILFHEQTISSIKITTDNKQIIIGSWDGKASIWNLEEIENNEKPISILNISELWITDVALIENTNLAITCDEHERMSIWDIEKQEIITTMRGLSVLLAQNNKVAVSSRYDHIEIWEIPSGRCLRGMETQGKEICLSLSNDNLFLLTRNEDDIISVWDLCHCQRIAHLQSTECLCASMSSDGSIIVSGTEKDLYLWENISLRTFPLFKKACYLGSNFHQYTSTPELILKYARDAEKASKEKQYKSAFFHLKKIQSTPGYETATNLNNFILETALQADIALSGIENVILSNSIKTKNDITALSFLHHGQTTILAQDDTPLTQWNLENACIVHSWKHNHRPIATVSMTPDSLYILTGSWDGTATLWDINSPAPIHTYVIDDTWIQSVFIHPNGTFALCGSKKGKVQYINLTTNETITLQESANFPITHVHITSKDELIAIHVDGTIHIWTTPESEPKKFRPFSRKVNAFDISPNGQTAIFSTRNEEIYEVDLQNGKIINKFYHPEEVLCALHYINQQYFLSISQCCSLRLWERETDFSLEQTNLHERRITKAIFSADSCALLTSTDSKEIKLWDIYYTYED